MLREYIEKLKAEKEAYKPEENKSACLRWKSDRDIKYMMWCTMATVCCARDSGRFDVIAAHMFVGCCVQSVCVLVHCVPDSVWRARQGCGLFCDVTKDGCHLQDRKKDLLCCVGLCCCDPMSEAILENYEQSGFVELLADENYNKYKSGPLAHQEMR